MKTAHALFQQHHGEDVLTAPSYDLINTTVSNEALRLERQCDNVDLDLVSLEALVDALQESRETGLEHNSLQHARITLESIQQRYQITQLELPSMEQFQGRQARLSTSISMENVKETWQKVWEWLKALFVKVVDWLKRHYHLLSRNLDVMASDAVKLKEFVRRNKFEGGQTLSLGTTAAKIHVNGKVTKDFTSQLNLIGQLTRVSEETMDKVFKTIEEHLTHEESYMVRTAMPPAPIPAGWGLYKDAPRFSTGPQSQKLYVSPAQAGGVALLAEVFGANDKVTAHSFDGETYRGRVSKVQVYVGEVSDQAEQLSSQEIFALCQRIDKAVASLRSSRSVVNDHLKKLMNHLERYIKERGAQITPHDRAKLRQSWSQAHTYALQLMRESEVLAFGVCAGYLEYARKSVRASQQAA